jgi:spore germination protein KC
MRNRQRKFRDSLLLILLIFTFLSLTGCWSSHEINELAIINVMGVDRNNEGDFEVSILTLRPDTLYARGGTAGGGGGGISNSPFLVTTTTGKSLYEAMQKFSSVLAKRMYWAHMQVVVFSEDVAREGIEPVMDMLKRHDEIRPNVRVLITKGNAKNILMLQPKLENTLGSEIYKIIEYGRFNSTPIVRDVAEFMNDLSSDTKDVVTGEISIASNEGINVESLTQEQKQMMQQRKKDQQDPPGLSIRGLAVFKEGRLIGWLNHEEARGVSWLRGRQQDGVVVVACPGNNEGAISVEITESESQLTPQVSEGKPNMNVRITVNGTIREITCPDYHLTSGQIERLNSQVEQKINKEITHVLNKVQKNWQSDIFGFGESIYQKYPKHWEVLAPHWRDRWLREMNVNVEILSNVSRSGLIYDPAEANKSR